MLDKRYKALFVNSGILGHRSVSGLLRQAAEGDPEIDATHINLSEGLTAKDKVIRRALCFELVRGESAATNLDLARWRQELHAGLLARRRIRARERRGARFDVLHFHTQATAYMSLRRMRHTPSVISIDCTQTLASLEAPSPYARRTYWPNIAHDGRVFRAAAAIVSISRWAAEDLARTYPDCADKVRVMPYPVRLDCFSDTWAEERYARRAADPEAPVRVLFIGGDFPRKGGFDLLDAWRSDSLDKYARLDLVTDWPLAEAELPAGVRLVRGVAPFTREWIELWREAELFVMPTRSEAFGMVYQEAAAAGLPAIGTSINAIPEIIEDSVTGRLIPSRDVLALTAAIKTLSRSAELRRRMGREARSRAETQFSPDKYSEKLTSLIKGLARGSACGSSLRYTPACGNSL